MSTGEASHTVQKAVALIDVRSAQNVGAIFRTADALSVSAVYLVGYTPLPVDRFGRAQPDIQKTALGAEHTVPWQHVPDSASFLRECRREGRAVVVLEQHDRALDYKAYEPPDNVVVVFGNEIDGVSKEVCDAADAIVSIPMYGKKESLNVSVAAGVVLYRFFDRQSL